MKQGIKAVIFLAMITILSSCGGDARKGTYGGGVFGKKVNIAECGYGKTAVCEAKAEKFCRAKDKEVKRRFVSKGIPGSRIGVFGLTYYFDCV